MKRYIFLLILLTILLSSCSFNMEIKNPFKKSEGSSFNFGENNWKSVNL